MNGADPTTVKKAKTAGVEKGYDQNQWVAHGFLHRHPRVDTYAGGRSTSRL